MHVAVDGPAGAQVVAAPPTPGRVPFQHGETVAQVAVRSRPAVQAALRRIGPGETGVLVTHGVTARALTADLIGLDQSVAWRSYSGLGNCHWARLGERADGWRIDAWTVGAPDLGSA